MIDQTGLEFEAIVWSAHVEVVGHEVSTAIRRFSPESYQWATSVTDPGGWTTFRVGASPSLDDAMLATTKVTMDALGYDPELSAPDLTLEIIPDPPQPEDRISELESLVGQLCNDLNQAHNALILSQGGDPARHDWPEWSPQANSIRWAEDLLGKRLAKTSAWTHFPGGTEDQP